MSDRVIISEAWYHCPIHGMQHHPLGPDVGTPCGKCAEEHYRAMGMTEGEIRKMTCEHDWEPWNPSPFGSGCFRFCKKCRIGEGDPNHCSEQVPPKDR